MGSCLSLPSPSQSAAARSRSFDKQFEIEQREEKRKIKVLLLGTGDAGKSTFLKQIRLLYRPYSVDERKAFKFHLHEYLMQSVQALIKKARELSQLVNPLSNADFETIVKYPSVEIVPFVAKSILKLWFEGHLQDIYESHADSLHLNRSCIDYFMPSKLLEVCSSSYVCSDDDILHIRRRTNQVVEEKVMINNTPFVFYDVGGQRTQRKKWLHLFNEVTAVIYVASLSDYDKKLEEDGTANSLIESVTVFEEIMANQKYFAKSSIILILNKFDLFREKVEKNGFRLDSSQKLFQDYHSSTVTGSDAVQSAKAYITSKFSNVFPKNRASALYVHQSCALDTSNMRIVIQACVDSILRENIDNVFGVKG
jgi:guanine nucleotide-binding protein G(i) subunit alpha